MSLVVVIMVIIVLIAGINYSLTSPSKETLEAVSEADKKFARVGEQINFTAKNSKGDIKSYLWEFGDGTTSNEVSLSHVYENSDWYNVTLIVEGKNGKEVNSTLLIGIQRNDTFEEGESGVILALRQGIGRGYMVVVEVGPNIGQPTIETRANVYTAVGLLEFTIEIEWELSDEEFDSLEIYTETIVAGGEDVQFIYNVMPDEIPEEVQIYPSEAQVGVICWEGGWENALILENAFFPIENLNQ